MYKKFTPFSQCFPIRYLQKDHTQTGQEGSGHVGADLEVTNGDAGMEVDRSTGAGGSRRARRRVGGRGGLGGHGTSSSSAGFLDLSGASTGRGSRGLGRGRAGEVTGAGVLVLLIVVLVQGEGELVLDLAHAVRTVLAGGAVGADTAAVSVAANGAEQFSQLSVGEAAGSDTGGLFVDAVAEVGIRSWGQGRGLGLPATSYRRAALQSGVGRGVGSLVGTGRVDASNLARVVLEVGHGAHAGGVDDGNQT